MASGIAPYRCHRTTGPVIVDGSLNEAAWAQAQRTPRFAQAGDGRQALLDTRAALLWDDAALYAGFWLEERDVWSTGQERTSLLWEENAVGISLAGPDAFYELWVSPANQTSEIFFIWKDGYTRGGRYDLPEFDLAAQRPMVFGGDAGPAHPRGMRWGFLDWRLPGLRTAVQVDGTLDRRDDVDRGWSVEIALPWEGLSRLTRASLPPAVGEVWPISLTRVQVLDHRAQRYAAIWQPYPLGDGGLPLPDRFPKVEFAEAR